MPGRNGDEKPITPVSLTTGTTGVPRRIRAGIRDSKNLRTCSPENSGICSQLSLKARCGYPTLTQTRCVCGPGERAGGRMIDPGCDEGHMAMKIYMLILLLGAIAAFAHMSSFSGPAKPGRLG
jgi:hypothetical protein